VHKETRRVQREHLEESDFSRSTRSELSLPQTPLQVVPVTP